MNQPPSWYIRRMCRGAWSVSEGVWQHKHLGKTRWKRTCEALAKISQCPTKSIKSKFQYISSIDPVCSSSSAKYHPNSLWVILGSLAAGSWVPSWHGSSTSQATQQQTATATQLIHEHLQPGWSRLIHFVNRISGDGLRHILNLIGSICGYDVYILHMFLLSPVVTCSIHFSSSDLYRNAPEAPSNAHRSGDGPHGSQHLATGIAVTRCYQ
jgi:hypothetical protein